METKLWFAGAHTAPAPAPTTLRRRCLAGGLRVIPKVDHKLGLAAAICASLHGGSAELQEIIESSKHLVANVGAVSRATEIASAQTSATNIECVERLAHGRSAPPPDAYIMALPNGVCRPFVDAVRSAGPSHGVVVDLSADHRFDNEWVYGLPGTSQ